MENRYESKILNCNNSKRKHTQMFLRKQKITTMVILIGS